MRLPRPPAWPSALLAVAAAIVLAGCVTPPTAQAQRQSQAQVPAQGQFQVPPQGVTMTVKTNGWQPPPGAVAVPLSMPPGSYDYSDFKLVLNGRPMTPEAGLRALAAFNALQLGQIGPEPNPVAARARVVLPDHDRLRVLAMQVLKRTSGGVVDFSAEDQRLGAYLVADMIARRRLFGTVEIAEQNDTTAPDPAGADYLIWYQVQSAGGGNAGPWLGVWHIKRAGRAEVETLGFDPGTPAGPARLASFAASIRLAASRLTNGAVAASADGVHRLAGGGSGVVIDAQGHVLTNNHVVAGCPDLRIVTNDGGHGAASVQGADAANDLAVLRTDRPATAWARFRASRGLRPGSPVVVTGFPLAGLVSPEMSVTTGSLTTLAGGHGDTRQFQFSAPIQPGNSGGPVMDDAGRVIGIATATLNSMVVAAATGGAVPQNVNFAIKSDSVAEFLAASRVSVSEATGGAALDAAEIGERARAFTVKVECWR